MHIFAIQAGLVGLKVGSEPISRKALQLMEGSRQAGVFVPSLLAQNLAKYPTSERAQILAEIFPQLSEMDRNSLNQELDASVDLQSVCMAPDKSISEKVADKNYSVSIEGSMENDLLGSGCLYLKENGRIVDSVRITAGGFGSGAPENGEYTIDHHRNRRKGGGDYNKGMNREGVGFSFDLNPMFDTQRSLLRVHPDGNKRGTQGCIGLEGDKADLLEFESNVKKILKEHDAISTQIQIEGNPNNSHPPEKKSKIQE